MKDMENIERLRTGDMKALGKIYDLHRDGFVKSICGKFGCGDDEAGELFNDTLIKLYREVQKGKFNEERDGGLAGWLFTTGKNLFLQKLRKERRLPVHVTSAETDISNFPDDESGQYNPEIDVLEENALKTLERMPPACRRLLTMFYLENKSLIEIAETLGRSYKAVKKDRWLCLQGLKKIILP